MCLFFSPRRAPGGAAPMPVPVLLLPGVLCTPRLWAPVLRCLAALGHDPSRFLALPATQREAMPEAAAELLAAHPAPRLALAGLSMGGYIALAAAAAAPARVAGLALLNSQCRPDSAEVRARRLAQVAGVAGAGGRLHGLLEAQARVLLHPSRLPADASAAIAALAAGGGGGGSHPALDPAFAEFVRGALESGAQAFARQQRCVMSRGDTSSTLAALAAAGAPMAVLTGSHDGLIPAKVARDMHALMGAAGGSGGAVVLEGCGHLSTLEAPAEVAAVLHEWLARVDAAEAARGRAVSGPPPQSVVQK